MFFLLTHHLHTENDHLLKLLDQRVLGASQKDLDDHESLERAQHELEVTLAEFDGNQDEEVGHSFYLAFTRFHGRYLEHIFHEELVTEALLLGHFSAEELQENSMRIMQTVEFHVLLLSLKYIVPAQSENENLRILRAFKTNAPKEALDAVLAIVAPEMSELDFLSLNRKL